MFFSDGRLSVDGMFCFSVEVEILLFFMIFIFILGLDFLLFKSSSFFFFFVKVFMLNLLEVVVKFLLVFFFGLLIFLMELLVFFLKDMCGLLFFENMKLLNCGSFCFLKVMLGKICEMLKELLCVSLISCVYEDFCSYEVFLVDLLMVVFGMFGMTFVIFFSFFNWFDSFFLLVKLGLSKFCCFFILGLWFVEFFMCFVLFFWFISYFDLCRGEALWINCAEFDFVFFGWVFMFVFELFMIMGGLFFNFFFLDMWFLLFLLNGVFFFFLEVMVFFFWYMRYCMSIKVYMINR